jgi:protein phosphatase
LQIIECGKASHKGKVRQLNEDSLLTLEYCLGKDSENILVGLYAIADGVGGHDDGEIASNLALQVLLKNLISSLLSSGTLEKPSLPDNEFLTKSLTEAVLAANHEVFTQGKRTVHGMGATLTVMLIVGSTICIANVGDSRLYLLRDNVLRQLTTDHSLVAALVATGEIKKDDVYTHPQRNIITRCLGMEQKLEIDLNTEELKPGDSFLLCSDGLWEMVRDNDIQTTIQQHDNPQSACEGLIEAANLNGGVDNISVILVKATK